MKGVRYRRHTLYDSSYMIYRIGKDVETESKLVVAMGWGRRVMDFLLG